MKVNRAQRRWSSGAFFWAPWCQVWIPELLMKQMRYWCCNKLELFHRYQYVIYSFLSYTSNIQLYVCVYLCGLFIFPSICKVLRVHTMPLKSFDCKEVQLIQQEDAAWYEEMEEKRSSASFILSLLPLRVWYVLFYVFDGWYIIMMFMKAYAKERLVWLSRWQNRKGDSQSEWENIHKHNR